MGRYTGPNCRLCRREGVKLFLKGDKCNSQSCILNKKPNIGGPKKLAKKPTEYAIQLREKQKIKRYYGLLEKQFRKYFDIAATHKGITGEVLLQIIERRLDNIVYRAGFASSRKEARQLVSHGHVLVNGKKVNIPSYLLKVNDVVTFKDSSKKLDNVVKAIESSENRKLPDWLEIDKNNVSVKLLKIPERAEINPDIEINEQLVVELYSK